MSSRVKVLLQQGTSRYVGARRAEARLNIWKAKNAGLDTIDPSTLPRWKRLRKLWEYCLRYGYSGRLWVFRERRGLKAGRSVFLKKASGIKSKTAAPTAAHRIPFMPTPPRTRAVAAAPVVPLTAPGRQLPEDFFTQFQYRNAVRQEVIMGQTTNTIQDEAQGNLNWLRPETLER